MNMAIKNLVVVRLWIVTEKKSYRIGENSELDRAKTIKAKQQIKPNHQNDIKCEDLHYQRGKQQSAWQQALTDKVL